MATHPTSTSLPLRTPKQEAIHPLAPVTVDEIRTTASLLHSQWPQGTDLQFKEITLHEPRKSELVPYLDAENHGTQRPQLDRRTFVNYYIRKTVWQSMFVL
jgi:primary-amine oxidase